ncbi:protein containing PEP-CTERM bacterial domain [methanotrophic bacterial endosymbiont of Bathymodiolus sp.]|nr:protein containing PEP-CTERM bacterial domain [methanotrophic bacterial endosymbiont of Bathymodiolus sp.]
MTGSEDRGALRPFEKSRDDANSLSFATFDLSDNITPVPEPSSLALLGLGLLGFAARKEKRNI